MTARHYCLFSTIAAVIYGAIAGGSVLWAGSPILGLVTFWVVMNVALAAGRVEVALDTFLKGVR